MQAYKSMLLVDAVHQFINDSKSGKRLMPSGKKIRCSTIEQYEVVAFLLQNFQLKNNIAYRILILPKAATSILQKEKNYWKKFFKNFSTYLYKERSSYDSYAMSVFKVIKACFNYFLKDVCLPIGTFHHQFSIPNNHNTAVVLSPQQVKFLITDINFEEKLSASLKRSKDIIIFGCTVGLRYADLMQLTYNNLQIIDGSYTILLHTQKTSTSIKIPLPDYAISIIKRYNKKNGIYILPRLSNSNLNIHFKSIGKLAGWTYNVPKIQYKKGEVVHIKSKENGCYQFYEHLSAHTMRRTAITTLLLLGVEEHNVRRISGHAAGSKEFYKYVIIVQDYLNQSVKKAFEQLVSNTNF